jgi:two-component system, OmpR family, sensor histidine kinase TctE
LKASAPSLFLRLVGAISAVLLGGTALLAYAAWSYATRAADDAYDQLLIGAAMQIRETLRVEDGQITTDIPVSAFDALSVSRQERVYYRVIGPMGETLTGYDDLPGAAAYSPAQQEIWNSFYKQSPVRIAALRQFMAGIAIPGWTTIIVAHTTETRAALARELTLRAMLLLAIMSLIALAGVAVAVRYALNPLHRIEAALANRAPNDLTPLAVQAPPEIAELIDAINRFMERLAERMDDLRRMIDDAAHQIRTPVTALAAQVDLLMAETSPARRKRHLERVSARTAQIGRLVNQLLSQALVSHRARSITAGPLDLRNVLRQAATDAIPAGMERDIAVTIDLPTEQLLIEGDPVSLREALRNIIDNAVQHGARTRLAIRASRRSAAVIAEISDDGPGIPEEHRPHVTRRFWRASADGEGFGLGLAIASEVARGHGAALSFGTAANGDFCISLSFPATGGA